MLKIAVGLVHNKNTNLANRQQISNMLPLIVTNYLPVGSNADTYESKYYTLAGVTTEHVVLFFQVVPYGVARPSNMDLIDSYNVIYGEGDNDKTGDHARFFNWLFKRGTDYGADVVIYVRFPNLFAAADLDLTLSRLTTTRVFIERVWGKAASLMLIRKLRERRQETLREDLLFDDAITDLRQRILALGLEYE